MHGGIHVDAGGIWEAFLLHLGEDEQKGELMIQVTLKFSSRFTCLGMEAR
jgi:hypothetical protein